MDWLEHLHLESLHRILAALSLVAVAALLSRWQRLELEGQIVTSVVRCFLQLIAIGYALTFVFKADNPMAIFAILCVMTTIAGYTAGERGKGISGAKWVAWVSIGFGTAVTLGLLIALGVFDYTAQQIIPIAGMVIGNSMNVCSVVMKSMVSQVRARAHYIEAALALGATSRQAVAPYLIEGLQTGMTPIVDSTKTVGLIQLPGAMTGMILAGATPVEAVQLQIIVMYMLLGAAAVTGMMAGWLSAKQFFTSHHQLVLERSEKEKS